MALGKREMTPLVSVIIPTYNVEMYIDQCIESIIKQTYSNFEIIICDDYSTDKTIEKLEKYKMISNITILYNEKNLRQARTRNRCIKASKGDYILMQDADDIAEPERIERLIREFEPKINFVGSGCYYFNEKMGCFGNWNVRCSYPQKRDLLFGIPFAHASIMFRRECLIKVGGYRYSKYTQRGEDYDLILRLYAAGYRGKNIPDLLYGYRVDRKVISRRTFKSRLDECHIRYEGFKANGILFPVGWIWVFKPIPAYFYRKIKDRKLK